MRSNCGKVLVLGYFGYKNNQLDGQTVKTRNIFTLIKSKEGVFFKKVSFFDTQKFQISKINLLKAFKAISKSNLLYYLPAHNNLKYLFPFIFIYCKLFRVKIHYIVVGGWLTEYLKNKPLHRWMLAKVNGIYPQTIELTKNLKQDYNFENVHQLHNFRIVETNTIIPNKSERIRLVFMARVHPLKGIDTIFKVAEELIKKEIKNVEIDIYGPIFYDYKNDFKLHLNKNSLVSYKGVLQPNEIYCTLVKYNLMLFPTQFFTEGFPGSILDSYIAKVPVIATKWKYADEFIENGSSGIIVDFGSDDMFISETIKLIQSPSILKELKTGAANQAENYSPERAWEILKNQLNI
ncbi:glycosyltransferase [Arenibacter sp. 6A1]|uniref:glycosyltransferase n=1 Tax=Arenibacter sp. 6A1 TaxID=2720391 RepID=UPI001446597C|nr:glycosyltransferase [Arenibacter sp. 6A1]NKI25227.1 glycosyltransferase [Arenibacter sp. 6A1]